MEDYNYDTTTHILYFVIKCQKSTMAQLIKNLELEKRV